MRDFITCRQFGDETGINLQAFYLKEGHWICLNFVRQFSNIGKFYCLTEEFGEAFASDKPVRLSSKDGQLWAFPTVCQSFDVKIRRRDIEEIVHRGGGARF